MAKAQNECFAAGLEFARAEGIVPAPESTHGIAAAISEARECRETGEERTIFVLVTGHAHFDLAAYDDHLAGRMTDSVLSDEELAISLDQLPVVAADQGGAR